MARQGKPHFRMMRFRKNDPIHSLHAAVQHFVHSRGGTAILTDGPEVQQWPTDREFTYRVAIRVTGRRPKQTKPKLAVTRG